LQLITLDLLFHLWKFCGFHQQKTLHRHVAAPGNMPLWNDTNKFFRSKEANKMDRKLDVMALAGILFFLIYTTNAGAQNRAHADIINAEGKSIGTASLRETKDGVVMTVTVKGLPEGLHAVHFHSVGKCESPAFTSAGPHFNPWNKKHGLKNPAGPHAGDLPDMYVQRNGVGRYEVLADSITLGSAETSIFDVDRTSLIIHATADDNITDPTGNSGDRIACGVITKTAGKEM
jgi:Cu-Zn family superoxide dismutase